MKTGRLFFCFIGLLLILGGCSTHDNAPNEDSSANKNSPTVTEDNGEVSPSSRLEQWSVTEEGIVPIRVGMSVAEASQVSGLKLTPVGSDTNCHYVKAEGGPPGVSLMVVDDHIARVDVEDPSVATSVGAHIGDSEERIKRLYLNQVEVTPHKYTEGHYLTVTPSGSSYRIVFETDGEKVTRYRAGRMPEVSWVEGCS